MDVEKIVTIGELSSILKIPHHRIRYYLKSRCIEPVRRLGGGVRLFSPEVIDQLRAEIKCLPDPQTKETTAMGGQGE
jgi:DNA-binding transcriptional MerR regulator